MVKKFRQNRVWRLLQQCPGLTRAEVAERVGIPLHAASNTLRRMRERGCVRESDDLWKRLWYACGQPPKDDRGQHANSARNITNTARERMKFLRMANIAKGLDPDKMKSRHYVPLAVSACELERVWKSAFPSTQDEEIEA